MSDATLEFLRSVVGADNVSVTLADREAHSLDESHHPPHLPDYVVWPDNEEQISRILAYANEHRIPVTARSGGSSLDGNPIPVFGGIVLCFYRWDKILEVRPEDMLCVVQPGIVYDELNRQLARYGLMYPPAPASHDVATIGGMVNNGSGGMHAFRYGVTRDYVLQLRVVLADGRILKIGSQAAKSASGYDLVRLFVGSEGTLGIITEITLKLRAIPEKSAALAVFPTVEEAARAASQIIAAGIIPGAMELMDAETVAFANRYCSLDLPESPMLVLEFHGTPSSVREDVEVVKEIAAECGCTLYRPATTAEERENVWRARSQAHMAVKELNRDCVVTIGDIVVPISKYPDAVKQAHALGKKYGIRVCTFGHAGDGNVHTDTIARRDVPGEPERAHQVHAELIRWTVEVGGTCTGEHGIGLGKREFLELEHGPAVAVMREIKRLFDPNGILNPGKIFLQ